MSNIWVNRTDTSVSLAHQGSGSVVYSVEIPGVGVYQSYSYTPTDSWFSTGWNNETGYLYDLLEHDIPRINERVSYLEADLKVSGINIKIADVAGGMMSQLKAWKTRANTKLVTSVTSTATTFSTLDTSDFAAGAALMWVGQECIKRTAISGVSFTGLTRGYLGTLQQPYNVVSTDEPPTRPLITDGPHGLYRRSVYIHAAVIDPATDLPGVSTVIFRGRIKKGTKVGKGKFDIAIEHKVAVFGDKVGQDMPVAGILPNQYWCSGLSLEASSFHSGNKLRIETHSGAGGTGVFDIIPDEGAYTIGVVPAPLNSLSEEWNSKSAATGAAAEPAVWLDGERFKLTAPSPGANLYTQVDVVRGSPLWMLGFDSGFIEGETNTALDVVAPNPPRPLAMDCSNVDAVRPTLRVDDSYVLTSGLRAQIAGNYACKITNISVSGSHHTVTIDPLDGDFWGEQRFARGAGSLYYSVEEEENMLFRHCIVLGAPGESVTVKNALQRLLGVSRVATGVDEPRSWFPQDVHIDDIDWDELDEAIASVPATFSVWTDVILEGIEVWKALGGYFALFGITPRLSDGGKIGFKRMDDMLSTDAETVPVDNDVWDGANAAQVMGRMAHGPMVNVVNIKHSYDYRFENGEPAKGIGWGTAPSEWGQPIKIRNASGIAEMAGVKSVEYELRGFRPVGLFTGMTLIEAAQAIKLQVNATHFTLYGLESGTTTIPATWIGKQFKVGDTVLLTHEVVPDTADGVLGITAKPVKIEGAIRNITRDSPDELTVRYGPTTFVAGIAPCAHGDTWTVGTLTMDFSAATTPKYEQAGKNDLTRFVQSAGTVAVLLTQRDDATPLTYSGTIAAGGVTPAAKTVVFSADPFSGAGLPTGGVYMTLPDWDSAATWQQAYAYSANLSVPPTLGSNSDHHKEWAL